MSDLIYKDESFKVIGCCIEVYNTLGRGFLEVVYKDALEYEFNKNNLPYHREKEFPVPYKEIVLPRKFYADFTVFDKIILEVKHAEMISKEYIAKTLNYLTVSKYKLGLIVNFGESSLNHKRIVL